MTYARPELPAITEKDVGDLELAAELGADFIALSFIRSAADMEQLRTLARDLGSAARLIAKVERSRPTRRSTRSSRPPTG